MIAFGDCQRAQHNTRNRAFPAILPEVMREHHTESRAQSLSTRSGHHPVGCEAESRLECARVRPAWAHFRHIRPPPRDPSDTQPLKELVDRGRIELPTPGFSVVPATGKYRGSRITIDEFSRA